MKTKKVYVSFDGKVFDTRKECEEYEKSIEEKDKEKDKNYE